MSDSRGPILIVAKDSRNGIGFQGGLPWPRIPEDMRHFRQVTENHIVIMGRKTFESMGKRPLPNRINVVVSRSGGLSLRQGVVVTTELHHALSITAHAPEKKVFVIGGGELYTAALPLAQEMIVTQLNEQYECDTFFPQHDPAEWNILSFRDVLTPALPSRCFGVIHYSRDAHTATHHPV